MAVADFEGLVEKVARLSPVAGLAPMDLLDLPAPVARLLRHVLRCGSASLDELAATLQLEPAQASQIGAALVERGYLLADPPTPGTPLKYRVRLTSPRRRPSALNL